MDYLVQQMTKIIKRKLIHAKSAKKYYNDNKKIILEKATKKRLADTESYNAKQREYYYNNHELSKEKNRMAMRRFRARHKKAGFRPSADEGGMEGEIKERRKKSVIKPQNKLEIKPQIFPIKFYDDGVELTED
jgi:hypothetical protein